MKFAPDLSKADLQLLAGNYRATLLKVESCVSRASTQCVRTHYEVTDGPRPGGRVSVVTPVAGKGARFFVDLARAFDPSYIEGEFDFSEHIGKPVLLEVTFVRAAGVLRSYQKIFPRHPDTVIAANCSGIVETKQQPAQE